MSRGFGTMQRRIILALETYRDSGNEIPLCWYEKEALGFGSSAAESSSFRRAVHSLATAGEVEFRHGHLPPLLRSESLYYTRNRPVATRSELTQGMRSRLMVRLIPTPEDHDESQRVQASLREAFRVPQEGSSPRRRAWAARYRNWYYDERPYGAWTPDELDDDEEEEQDYKAILDQLQKAMAARPQH